MGSFRTGRRRVAALAVGMGLAGGTALGQEPAPLPAAVTGQPATGIEVYYGTTKVAPIPLAPAQPKPAEPKAVVEAPRPRVESPIYVPVVMPASAWSTPMPAPAVAGPIMPARFEFTLPRNQSPMMTLLSVVARRLMLAMAPQPTNVYTSTTPSTPSVIIIRESAPEPRPLPITIPPAPPAQVVVIHEPAPEPMPAPPAPAPSAEAFKMTPELMVSAGVGLICLFGVTIALVRSGRPIAMMPGPMPFHAAASGPPMNHDPSKDGRLLMGQYKAGQPPETAERFEIGPSYQDEQREKLQREEAGKQAVVAHILSQNLDLLEEPASEPGDDFSVEVRS